MQSVETQGELFVFKTRCKFVCHCLQVTEHQIREVLAIGDVQSVHDVRAITGAGGGCTACHCKIERLIAEYEVPTLDEVA